MCVGLLDVTDSQYVYVLSLLRSVKQKVGETIQVYAERILFLAGEAFVGQRSYAVERQLIDTFVDRLVNNDQGPVVQSVVSLTSSLRVISLTVLADSIHNILILFAEKM